MGMTPVGVDFDREDARVQWLDLQAYDFAEPMFSGTVRRALSEGQTPVVSGPDGLLDVADGAELLQPTAFVFHGARAGGTLLSMLLRQAREALVLNEPKCTCLAIAHQGEDERLDWLRALVRCLGQRRRPGQRGFFVTYSSWAVLRADRIRRAFPDVPCIFLYRDPFEVVDSLLGFSPKWANAPRNGLDILVDEPIIGPDPMAMPDPEFFARAVGAFNLAAAGMRLLNYSELPALTPSKLEALFGVSFSVEDARRMVEALPGFTARERSLQRPVRPDPAVRDATERYALPSYERLEALRRAGASPST